MEVITPEEFEKRMQDLVDKHLHESEVLFDNIIELLSETLEPLGYEKGIAIDYRVLLAKYTAKIIQPYL